MFISVDDTWVAAGENKAKRHAAKTTRLSAIGFAVYKKLKNKLKTSIHEAKLHI